MRGANRHLAFLALALVLACGAAVDAQLIIRNTEPYRNYAYEGYRPYESLVFGRDRTPQFDNMGQFVMNGVNVFELQEFRTLQTTPGSIIGKERQYGDFLNRLVIANDSYKGVDTRLIIGDRIRTKFTPLTLDLAAMNGLRVDSNFRDASLVSGCIARRSTHLRGHQKCRLRGPRPRRFAVQAVVEHLFAGRRPAHQAAGPGSGRELGQPVPHRQF